MTQLTLPGGKNYSETPLSGRNPGFPRVARETLAYGQIELSVSGDGRRLSPAISQLGVDTRHALHRSMFSTTNNKVARLPAQTPRLNRFFSYLSMLTFYMIFMIFR